MQQSLLTWRQIVEDPCSLVEEVVEQRRRHHWIVSGEVGPVRHPDVRKSDLREVVMQVSVGAPALVRTLVHHRRRPEVEGRTHCRRAIDEVVVLYHLRLQSTEEQQRLVHLDVLRIHRDDQMPRIEVLRAVLIHELHQREQNRAARAAEPGVYGQRGDFGDAARLATNRRQVEGRLQREPELAFADDGERADNLAVEPREQGRGRRQCMDLRPSAGDDSRALDQ